MRYMKKKDFNPYKEYLDEIKTMPKKSEVIKTLYVSIKKLESLKDDSSTLPILSDIINELKQLELELTPSRKLIKIGCILQSLEKDLN